MRLNSKIALILVIPMLALVGAFAWLINSQVLGRFAALEQAQQRDNHQRLEEAINSELDNLSRSSLDWAIFDDTYYYLQDLAPDYSKANFNLTTLQTLQIDGILLYDRQRQLHTQYSIEPHSQKTTELPAELLQQIAASLQPQPGGAAQRGILTFRGRTLELASSPITDSNAELPALGSLVLFKYLDQSAIDSLAKRIKLSLHIQPLQGAGNAHIAPEVIAGLSHQALWLHSEDANTASSFSILNDLAGQPALLMRVNMPRDIYREGLNTARQMLTFTFVALLLFVCGTFFAIHRVALRRLSRLSQRLIAIGTRGGSQERLPMRGADEISQVAQAANAMLDNLDQAFEQRRCASERQRELNALLVRIATDDDMAKGDTAALFRIMSSSLSVSTSLQGWSLWLSSEDGQRFECLRCNSATGTATLSADALQQALTSRDNGLPDYLPYPVGSTSNGLILPFHVDSHLGALCVEVSSPEALAQADEVGFLVAATQLIERTLRTHFQNLREQDLRQRAEIDPLTGLANRWMFEMALQKSLRQANASGAIVGLLFIDLDRFKPINDAHGHAVGDWLLCQVAERLRAQIRNDDLVARLGGDEFTVILNNLHAVEDARRITEKICQALAMTYAYPGISLHSGASIGLAWSPQHGNSVAELVKAADLAMYAAKQRGRGHWLAAGTENSAPAAQT